MIEILNPGQESLLIKRHNLAKGDTILGNESHVPILVTYPQKSNAARGVRLDNGVEVELKDEKYCRIQCKLSYAIISPVVVTDNY